MTDSIQATVSDAKPSPEQFDVCQGCSEKIDTLIHFAVLLEREACAKIVDAKLEPIVASYGSASIIETEVSALAASIRARGE